MKRAFIYKDEEIHKFWWIDYSGCDFAVCYGKCGETGTFEIMEFETEEECVARAEKRIRSKEKKGFIEDPDFDFMHINYFDSDDYPLHPKTSHPRFVEHFTDEFYYDDTEDESPFGEPDVFDVLKFLEEIIINNTKIENEDLPKVSYVDAPLYLVKKRWHVKYYPVDSLDAEHLASLDTQTIFDMLQNDYITYGCALGQIKISGTLSPELKEKGINALKRISIFNDAELTEIYGEGMAEMLNKVVEDLQSFPAGKD